MCPRSIPWLFGELFGADNFEVDETAIPESPAVADPIAHIDFHRGLIAGGNFELGAKHSGCIGICVSPAPKVEPWRIIFMDRIDMRYRLKVHIQ